MGQLSFKPIARQYKVEIRCNIRRKEKSVLIITKNKSIEIEDRNRIRKK